MKQTAMKHKRINSRKQSLFAGFSTLLPTLSQWNEIRTAYNILTPKSQEKGT
jgi:hypothetical protein